MSRRVRWDLTLLLVLVVLVVAQWVWIQALPEFESYDSSNLLDNATARLSNREIRVVGPPDDLKLEFHSFGGGSGARGEQEGVNLQSNFVGTSLLEQEINRFNGLPAQLRFGFDTSRRTEDFRTHLAAVSDQSSYWKLLETWAQRPSSSGPPFTPLFVVREREPYGWETGKQSEVVVNSEYGRSHRFTMPRSPESLPTILTRSSDRSIFVLENSEVKIEIEAESVPTEGARREITLKIEQAPRWQVSVESDSEPGASTGVIYGIDQSRPGAGRFEIVRFRVDGGHLLIMASRSHAVFRRRPDARWEAIREPAVRLRVGDSIRPDTLNPYPRGLEFRFLERRTPPVIGPAWVMGEWVLAYDTALEIHWLPSLITAVGQASERIGRERSEQLFGRLTLDPRLQQSAQDFVRRIGIEQFKPSPRTDQSKAYRNLPPRVALGVIDLPSGRVLAMGTWPRPGRARDWSRTDEGRMVPPLEWLQTEAPSLLTRRYLPDHNFTRLPMGSATKPLWAAAALQIHPEIRERFRVRGPAGKVQEVFGIPFGGSFTALSRSRSLTDRSRRTRDWSDFDSYIARSDNRYHVSLGILALADRANGSVAVEPISSESDSESMSRGLGIWRRYPAFPRYLRFNREFPRRISSIEQSPFIQEFKRMFDVETSTEFLANSSVSRSEAFWTRNQISPDEAQVLAFKSVSPERTNLELSEPGVRSEIPTRNFISILLGGSTNRWSNMEFASAFGRVVTGEPVFSRITEGNVTSAEIAGLRDVSRELRPGLQLVIENGTAATHIRDLPIVRELRRSGYRVYAKTGTLDEGDARVSRFVIAIVRWSNRTESEVDRGLVLTLVIADTCEMGAATLAMAQFLSDNGMTLQSYLMQMGG